MRGDADRRSRPGPERVPARTRRAALVALGLLVATLASCSRAPDAHGEPGPSVGIANLVTPQPAIEILERADLTHTEILSATDFEHTGAAGWRVDGGRTTARGLCAEEGASELRLERTAPPAALDATDLEVVAHEMESLYVELRWIPSESGRAPYRKRVFRVQAGGTDRSRFHFDLKPIGMRKAGDTIRVRVLNSPARRPCLASLAWLDVHLDPQRIESAAGHAWRVELDHELRDARLAPAGGALEITVPAGPPGRSLRLGFGALGTPKEPIAFSAEPADVATDGSPVSPARRVEIAPARAGRWHEIEVGPLAANVARRFRLRAELAPGDRGSGVLPIWSGGSIVHHAGARRRASDPRPDIVLISIDTLRADRMSLYGAERPTTPRLDEWARRRAVVFDSAIAQATWTLPSHASIFTGLEPHHHGALFTEPLSPSIPVLAELLRDAGYETRAVTGAGFLDPRYGMHRGFDRYRSWGGAWSAPDEIRDGTARALAELNEAHERPLFLFFHTYDVHGPFRPHQPYYSRWSRFPPDWWVLSEPIPGEPADRREPLFRMMRFPPRQSNQREPLSADMESMAFDLYDSGVASADEHVGRILERLRESGLERRTVVVVTSDHGESLGEHGLAGHGFLYEDNARIPLAIALPEGTGAGRRIAEQVRLVDLLPTLVDVGGARLPATVDGRSLLPWLRATEAPTHRLAATYSNSLGLALRRDGRWKFLFWDGTQADRERRDRFFDLATDPGETIDLLPRRDDRGRLEAEAIRHLADGVGLRARLPAVDPGAPTLTLAAPWLEGSHAKWISLPDPGVRHVDGGGIVVSPGSDRERVLLLHVPGSTEPTLTVSEPGAGGGDDTVTIELRGGALADGGLVVVRRDGRLAVLPRGRQAAADPVLVELDWQGDLAPAGEDPADRDPELERRLRALGYID